eukprot:jgi/Tetstr1/459920/TSEL_005260.t1
MPAVTSGRRQACSWTPAAPSGLAVFVVFTMAISPSFCQREASILRRSSSVTHPASTAAVGDVTASSAELGDLVLRTEVTTSILRPSADSDDEGEAKPTPGPEAVPSAAARDVLRLTRRPAEGGFAHGFPPAFLGSPPGSGAQPFTAALTQPARSSTAGSALRATAPPNALSSAFHQMWGQLGVSPSAPEPETPSARRGPDGPGTVNFNVFVSTDDLSAPTPAPPRPAERPATRGSGYLRVPVSPPPAETAPAQTPAPRGSGTRLHDGAPEEGRSSPSGAIAQRPIAPRGYYFRVPNAAPANAAPGHDDRVPGGALEGAGSAPRDHGSNGGDERRGTGAAPGQPLQPEARTPGPGRDGRSAVPGQSGSRRPSFTLVIAPDGSASTAPTAGNVGDADDAEGGSERDASEDSDGDDDEDDDNGDSEAASRTRRQPVRSAPAVDEAAISAALRDATAESTRNTIQELTAVLAQLRAAPAAPGTSPQAAGPAPAVDEAAISAALRDATRESTRSTIQELTAVLAQLRAAPTGPPPAPGDGDTDGTRGTASPTRAWDVGSWGPAEAIASPAADANVDIVSDAGAGGSNPAGPDAEAEGEAAEDVLQQIRAMLEEALQIRSTGIPIASVPIAVSPPPHHGHPPAKAGAGSGAPAPPGSFQAVYEECASHGRDSDAYMRACVEYSSPLASSDEAIYRACIADNIEFARYMGRRPDWEQINTCLSRRGANMPSQEIAYRQREAEDDDDDDGGGGWGGGQGGGRFQAQPPPLAPPAMALPPPQPLPGQPLQPLAPMQQFPGPPAALYQDWPPPGPPNPADSFYQSLDDSVRELFCYDQRSGRSVCY